MLNINNLSKVYRMENIFTTALNQINLKIKEAEFVSIMGPSGSGKSTLLHMIAGVETPTCGEIFINHVKINSLSISEQAVFRRRKIGMIYQAFNLIPTLTVQENILLPIILDNKKEDKKRIASLLELLDLTKRKNHLPNQLSGGEQQRTAIGRALMARPALLLADEPTGNLDSQNTKEVLSLLLAANVEYGQTVILVSHDENAARTARRQIIMKDGSIAVDKVV